jgi:hypothetical protein
MAFELTLLLISRLFIRKVAFALTPHPGAK